MKLIYSQKKLNCKNIYFNSLKLCQLKLDIFAIKFTLSIIKIKTDRKFKCRQNLKISFNFRSVEKTIGVNISIYIPPKICAACIRPF